MSKSRKAWNKKTNLVAIRGAATAATGVLLGFYPPADGLSAWAVALWVVYLATTVGYAALPPPWFAHPRFDMAFGGLEVLLLGGLLSFYVASATWTFYCLFLLAVLLAALARRLLWALGMGVAVAAGFVLFSLESLSADPGLVILQITLLLTTVGIIGYLTEELAKKEATTTLLDNALEVSTLLADAYAPDEVYDRLTELLARLFRAARVAVILSHSGEGTARVASAVDRGSRVTDLTIDLDRYPEIRTALRRSCPVVIGQVKNHPQMADVLEELPNRARHAAILVVPILRDDEAVGVLLVRLEDQRHTFTPHEVKFCRVMAEAASRAVRRAEHFAEMAEAARRDGLTGLYNVRVFHRRLSEEIQRADRTVDEFSLVLVDVDYLKHVNDTYGHLAGDRVIRHMAEILQGEVRNVDTVARYGGEEFVILLPGTPADRALLVAERLRKRVATVAHEGIEEPITVSVGIATYPDDATSPTELLHKVDLALYASKERGRNQTTPFSEMAPEERASDAPAGTDSRAIEAEIRRMSDPEAMERVREALRDLPARGERGGHVDVVTRLAAFLEEGDPDALEGLRTISTISEIFLGNLPLAERQRWTMHVACLIRDVGKAAMAEGVVEGGDYLTREEYRLVRLHPVIGSRIIEPLEGFELVVPMVRHHHERWDGKGYPNGLSGEEIPFGARVVGVVDAFHTLVRRGYADQTTGLRYACEEIRRNAGTHFDPEMADRFLFVVDANRDMMITLVRVTEDEPEKKGGGPDRDRPASRDLVAELDPCPTRRRGDDQELGEDRPTDDRASAGGSG